jgi:8-oxo-dGTP pyrophosphatase MutT (NUDIX family)
MSGTRGSADGDRESESVEGVRTRRRIGPWTIEQERAVYDNPWITVVDYKVLRPDGAPGQYGVVRFKHLAVGVLPLFDDGTVPLVGQHRFPHDCYSWELPEGGGAVGEDPLAAARRELAEETGLRARSWLKLIEFDLSNSVTDEKGVCYLAFGLEMGPAAPGPDEILAHRRLSFSALHNLVLAGEIRDSLTIIMTLAAAQLAAAGRLPEEAARLIARSA